MRLALTCLSAAMLICSVPTSAVAAEGGSCPLYRWTTLGTAGGPVPTLERGEPSNLLDAGDVKILVDSGDGAANKLAQVGRDFGRLDAVVISHLHWDHAGGLAAVIGLRWMNEYPGVLTIYGPKGTQSVVDGILASLEVPSQIGFGVGALPPRPGESVRVIELSDGDVVNIDGIGLRAVANNHFDKDGKRSVDMTESLSLRFTFDGRSITYTGDTGPDDAVTELAKDTDLLVSEVIALDPLLKEIRRHRPEMPEAMRAQMYEHLSTHHLSPEAVGTMAKDAGAKRVVLTHFAVPGPLSANEVFLRDGVRQHYDGPLDLGRDLSSFEVACGD